MGSPPRPCTELDCALSGPGPPRARENPVENYVETHGRGGNPAPPEGNNRRSRTAGPAPPGRHPGMPRYPHPGRPPPEITHRKRKPPTGMLTATTRHQIRSHRRLDELPVAMVHAALTTLLWHPHQTNWRWGSDAVLGGGVRSAGGGGVRSGTWAGRRRPGSGSRAARG